MTQTQQLTAEFVRDLEGFTGTAKLWRLSAPLEMRDWSDEVTGTTDYVVTSATVAMFSGPETYAFPATEDGKVSDWGELPGSQRGTFDHHGVIDAVCKRGGVW